MTYQFYDFVNPGNPIARVIRSEGDKKEYNLLKPNGTFVSEEWFTFVGKFFKGLAMVQRTDGLWNFIKVDGKFLTVEWFKSACDFSEDFALVQRENDLWNYLNPDGTFLSDEWFKEIEDFLCGYVDGVFCGFAKVQAQDGKYYEIDLNGNLTEHWNN